MSSSVWRQRRHVEVGPIALDGLDMDIDVYKPKDDPLEFDIRTWNLADAKWERIDEDEHLVRVELGWHDGRFDTVVLGEITHLNSQPDRGDVEFRTKGVDESEMATHHRLSDSWSNARPDQIASDIAQQVGLTPRVENAGDTISGTYAITVEQKARAWLDELLDYAVEFTGEEWEWYALEGALHFERRNATSVQAPLLAYGNTLTSIGKKSNPDEDVELELEFEAMLDPRIRTGAGVFVDTDRFEGAFRVSDYEFRSNTDTGDHLVRGTLVPVEGDFRRTDRTYPDIDQFDQIARETTL